MTTLTRPKINRGLMGVSIGETSLCEIDGNAGGLAYRGIAIEQLAKSCSYEETVYLLLYGDLPSPQQLDTLKAKLATFRALPSSISTLLKMNKHCSPIVSLQICLSALEADFRSDLSIQDLAMFLISVTGSIICAQHALHRGTDLLPPDPTLDHASDFYRRLTGTAPSEAQAELMNLDLVLHAEHGANASTTVARVASSGGASLYGAVTAALATLKGPKHGGAPETVLGIIEKIDGPEQARATVADFRARKEPFPGFGHRVYKVMDPRSVLYRLGLEKWIDAVDPKTPATIAIVDALIEEMAPFQRLQIAPNDDLLAALLYSALNIPKELCISLFAASRMVGWIGHYFEARHEQLLGPCLFYEQQSH